MKQNDATILAIRAIRNGCPPEMDISELLYRHKCYYLLSQWKGNRLLDRMKASKMLNVLCVQERYRVCQDMFLRFREKRIPFAVVKGAVLSDAAYKDPFCRISADIDLLIRKTDADRVKQILTSFGCVQGRVGDHGVVPFTRQEQLFQSAMTHQLPPFIHVSSDLLCPYVNIDINTDIFWGEKKEKTDMDFVLQHTQEHTIAGVSILKLSPEMEFIQLCLHHYKDMNSPYLLQIGKFNLALFCDIYFYIKNQKPDIAKTFALGEQLGAAQYLYYCMYYTQMIFDDEELQSLLCASEKYRDDTILDSFGLVPEQRHRWDADFPDRLFHTDFKQYFQEHLNTRELDKIELNMQYM